MKNNYQKIKTKRGLSPHRRTLVSQYLFKMLGGLFFLLMIGSYPVSAQSPVAVNGKLSVSGNFLVNQNGKAIQLRGMSSHGLQWYNEDYNFNSLSTLVNQWGINIFRLAMYPTLKSDRPPTGSAYDGNPVYWKSYCSKTGQT